MAITPDTKDWTWVLDRACAECGFDSTAVTGRDVPRLMRENADGWTAVLRHDAAVRARPQDARWSTLEYACHVRDVLRLFDWRLALMLSEDDPSFPNWDQDATAVSESYGAQDPAIVSAELADAARRLAGSIEALGDDAWGRTGTRSDGATFTVETFTRYLIHDPIHHLHDVGG
jgi:hypothetical protein